jgi:hypothetical protein
MLQEPSAAAICRLLATPERLKVVAALALGAGTLAEVAEAAGLDQRAAARALARLGSGGLVESGSDGTHRLRTEALAAAGQEESGEPAKAGEDFPSADPEAAKVLRRFISDGRLVAMPAPRGKRRVVLEYLAGAFEPGRRYEEREVNAILGAIHPDHATLRRYLVDEGFMDRERGQYWRSGGTVQVD